MRGKKVFVFVALTCFLAVSLAAQWMGNLKVYDKTVWPNGRLGNYGTVKYFLDEKENDSITIDITVEVYAGDLSAEQPEVQIYTNLNRRDLAKIWEPASDAGKEDSYYMTYPMTSMGKVGNNIIYRTQLPIDKCGAYRLTARFRVKDGHWRWHNEFTPNPYDSTKQRDCVIVVSPKKVLSLTLYEANPLVVEAVAGGTGAERSTFEDFTDKDNDGFDPFNLEYIKNTLGFNALWLMPIFPVTAFQWDRNRWEWTENFNPGSPYSTRNYWQVNPLLSDEKTGQAAMSEFKYLVKKADELGLDVFIDVALNHAGRDVVYGQGAVDLGLCAAGDRLKWVRQKRPSWCTRESGYQGNNFIPHYREHADNQTTCALWAPADRKNEHVWNDANVDWFFGDYSSLGPKGHFYHDPKGSATDERELFYTDLDPAGGHDFEVENLWNYFAYLLPYWLTLTDGGLDGIRADFAQGLPPRAWEYIINKTRQKKWDFVFLAEVLDPPQVMYRANRHFDVMTSVDHYLYRLNDITTTQLAASLEKEARNFGYNACIMHNGTSHDESGNPDQWAMVARYGICAACYGSPMIFMGQPLGIPGKIDFKERWSNIRDFWQDKNNAGVNGMYRRINRARAQSRALRAAPRYFLFNRANRFNDHIFAVARWDVSPPATEIVLVFVNLNTARPLEDTFIIPQALPLIPKDSDPVLSPDSVHYQAFNLVADNPDQPVWPTARSAADILKNGIYVKFTFPNEIQYLQLRRVE